MATAFMMAKQDFFSWKNQKIAKNGIQLPTKVSLKILLHTSRGSMRKLSQTFMHLTQTMTEISQKIQKKVKKIGLWPLWENRIRKYKKMCVQGAPSDPLTYSVV